MIRDVGVEYWDGYELGTCKRIKCNFDTEIGIYLKGTNLFRKQGYEVALELRLDDGHHVSHLRERRLDF